MKQNERQNITMQRRSTVVPRAANTLSSIILKNFTWETVLEAISYLREITIEEKHFRPGISQNSANDDGYSKNIKGSTCLLYDERFKRRVAAITDLMRTSDVL